MLEVTVKRSQWLRGEGGMASFLLRGSDGKMCCMGFAALAAGATPSDIVGRKTVNGKNTYTMTAQVPAIHATGDDLKALYDNNDNTFLSQAKRETNITIEGLKIGIKFTFVD